jgi:hypothetical protein
VFTTIAVTFIVVFVLAAVGVPIWHRRRKARRKADSVGVDLAVTPGEVKASGIQPLPPVDPGGGPAPASVLAKLPTDTAPAVSAPTASTAPCADSPESLRQDDQAPVDPQRASLPG